MMSEKLYRYMSWYEFIKMSQGIKIQSLVDYSKIKKTSSRGICFLGEKTLKGFLYGSDPIEKPEDCLEYLGGIVSNDVLVEFEITDQALVNESMGTYKDGEHAEYWMDYYDNKVLIPLRYKTSVQYFDKLEWQDYDEHKISDNPKSIIKQVAERMIEEYGSVSNIQELCTIISSAIPSNDGWYIEMDKENRSN